MKVRHFVIVSVPLFRKEGEAAGWCVDSSKGSVRFNLCEMELLYNSLICTILH